MLPEAKILQIAGASLLLTRFGRLQISERFELCAGLCIEGNRDRLRDPPMRQWRSWLWIIKPCTPGPRTHAYGHVVGLEAHRGVVRKNLEILVRSQVALVASTV
jgi:hypothetical protein